MKELVIDGMCMAPSVVETVVAKAVADVEGVSKVASGSPTGLLGNLFGSNSAPQSVVAAVGEDNTLRIAVRIEAEYGNPLPELAAKVRKTVADAVASQLGLPVGSVDVYVDAIQFSK